MSIDIQVCPHCGNYVQATKVKSYANKVARQGAKSAVHTFTSAGGAATGAAIGSAIFPGLGTLVGGALGFVGSAMFNQAVNSGIDDLADSITDFDLDFKCPRCGHFWQIKSEDTKTLNVDAEHGVSQGNTDGMMLRMNFSIIGHKDETCQIAAFVADADDNLLMDENGVSCDGDGYVCFVEEIIPSSDYERIENHEGFLPYNELHITKPGDYKIIVALFDSDSKLIMKSESSFNCQGSLERIWTWDDSKSKNNSIGFTIHTKFSVENMVNENGSVIVFFRNPETGDYYCDRNDEPIVVEFDFKPPYESCLYEDFQIPVPSSLIKSMNGSLVYQVLVKNNSQGHSILMSNFSKEIIL